MRSRPLFLLAAATTVAVVACKKKSSGNDLPPCTTPPPATDARVYDAATTTDGRWAFVAGELIHRSGECNAIETDDDVVWVVDLATATTSAAVHVRRATAGTLTVRGQELLILPVSGGTELRRLPVAGPWTLTTDQLPARVDSIAVSGERAFLVSRTQQALYVDSGAGAQPSVTFPAPPTGLVAGFGELFLPSSDGHLYLVSATAQTLAATLDLTGCQLRGTGVLEARAAIACGSGGLRLVDPAAPATLVARTDYAAAVSGRPGLSRGLVSAGPDSATPITRVWPGDFALTPGLIESRVLFQGTSAWAIVGSELIRFALDSSGNADPIAAVEFFHTVLAGGEGAPLVAAVAVPDAGRIDFYVVTSAGLGAPLPLTGP